MMFDGVISKPVLKMRGSGEPRDPPAPVRDPLTGTAASNVAKRPCPLAQTFALVPSGESPDGTGGPSELPTSHFLRPGNCSGQPRIDANAREFNGSDS